MEEKLSYTATNQRTQVDPPEAGRGKKGFFLEPSERAACQHLDFRHPEASRTVREQTVIVSNKIFSNLLWQPWETNTDSHQSKI